MIANWKGIWCVLRNRGLLGSSAWLGAWRWLWSYWHFGATLYTLLAVNAWQHPEALAIDDGQHRCSYRELEAAAHSVARQLQRLRPRVVMLLCKNHLAQVACLLACQRLGARVLLGNSFMTADQLEAVGAREPADLVIADRALLERLPLKAAPKLCAEDLLAQTSPARGALPWRVRGAALVLLTSGTTGQPKAVTRRVSLTQALRSTHWLLERLPVRAGQRVLLTTPLFHGQGLAALALSLGSNSALYLRAANDPAAIHECLESQRITTLVLVPTSLARLVARAEGHRFPDLKAVVSGSAPLTAALCERATEVFGSVLYNLYGSSEAGPIALATPAQLRVSPGSVGAIMPGVEVQLRDSIHAQGTIFVRSAWTRQDWFDTGDIGAFDASGHLQVLGRCDQTLLIGAENHHPEALEARFAAHPDILECAVRGVPDAEYGQRIALWVVVRQGVSTAQLERDLRACLPRALWPAQVQVVTALPRNALGKLQRDQLIRDALQVEL